MAQSFVVGANAMSDKVGSACVHVHPCMCIIFNIFSLFEKYVLVYSP